MNQLSGQSAKYNDLNGTYSLSFLTLINGVQSHLVVVLEVFVFKTPLLKKKVR